MSQDEIIARLAEMSTATISDVLFHMGHKNRTMRANIKPVDPSMRMCGPAVTAYAYPGGTYASSLALEKAGPGDIIVLDGQGFLGAVLWGEVFSWMAAAKGIAGAVIDGAVRDITGVLEAGFPLFAAGIHPGAGTGDKQGEVDLPVHCGGVVVNPGDYVFGDMLGVVVVPPPLLERVLERSIELLAKEEAIIARCREQVKERQSRQGNG